MTLSLLSLVCGCGPTAPEAHRVAAPPRTTVTVDDALVQFSLLASLAAGDYLDGPRLSELLAVGDFGIGTFHRLDGEMIVLDGHVYQASADGVIRQPSLDVTAPFAAVTFFDEDGRVENLAAHSLDLLDARINQSLPHRNLPYALRIDGEFSELTLRSVPAQNPPYEPLVDVVKQQVTWEHHNLRGTLVGLHCPGWIGNLNVTGYHWHFLSEDRQIGGHVLACQLKQGTLRYDACRSLVVRLPESDVFDRFDAQSIDQQDIDAIERQRERPSDSR
jgi:acetolactate decarboxylase